MSRSRRKTPQKGWGKCGCCDREKLKGRWRKTCNRLVRCGIFDAFPRDHWSHANRQWLDPLSPEFCSEWWAIPYADRVLVPYSKWWRIIFK